MLDARSPVEILRQLSALGCQWQVDGRVITCPPTTWILRAKLTLIIRHILATREDLLLEEHSILSLKIML